MRISPVRTLPYSNKQTFKGKEEEAQRVLILRNMSSQDFYDLLDGFGILVDKQDQKKIELFGFPGIKDYVERLVSVGLAETDNQGRLYINNTAHNSLSSLRKPKSLNTLGRNKTIVSEKELKEKTLEVINLLEQLAEEEDRTPLRVKHDTKAFDRDLKQYISPKSLQIIEHQKMEEVAAAKAKKLTGHLLFLSQDNKRREKVQKLQKMLAFFDGLPLDDRAYQYIIVNHVTKGMSSNELIYHVLAYMKYNIYTETAGVSCEISKNYNSAKYPHTVESLKLKLIDYLVKKAPNCSQDTFKKSLIYHLKTNFNNALIALSRDANYDINSGDIHIYYKFVAKLIDTYKLDTEEPNLLLNLTEYYKKQVKILRSEAIYRPVTVKAADKGHWKYGPGIQKKK